MEQDCEGWRVFKPGGITRQLGNRGNTKAWSELSDPLGSETALARASKDAKPVRRLLALAAIYEGSTRSEAARIGGVTLQIVRDRVVRFNARGPTGLIDGKAPGGRC